MIESFLIISAFRMLHLCLIILSCIRETILSTNNRNIIFDLDVQRNVLKALHACLFFFGFRNY